MENKFYDLIIENIKAHKKFVGLDDIIDDIANDVYEHSKVVFESVSDEAIIISYIQKVVSTSIVTVPKRLGISSRASQKVLEEILPRLNSKKVEKTFEEEFDNEFVNEVIIDDELQDNEDSEFEELINDAQVVEIDTDVLVETEVEAFESVELLDDAQHIVESEETLVQDVAEVEVFYPSDEEHKSFVDKMINGVSEEQVSLDVVDIENDDFNIQDETETFSEKSDIEELIFSDELGLEEEETEFFVEESNLELLEEEVTDYSEGIEAIQTFVKPVYDCFSYEPTTTCEYDLDDVLADINDLDEKCPNLEIKAVWNLKYNKKMSVEQISKELNVSSDDVVEALCELADIIRG